MAQITLDDVYIGEKYDVFGKVGKELVDIPTMSYDPVDERTRIELLIVKYTILAVEQMQKNGDYIPNLIDVHPNI